MKRNAILLAMFSLMALWLSGCIISTSPSTTAPVTLNVGASKAFSVTGLMNGPYEWSKNDIVIPGAIKASYSYTALEADAGIFVLKVQTKDSLSGKILVKQWNVHVVANLPPTANAGPDQSVAPGTLVTLDGSASSDPESQPLSYTWSITTAPGGSTATIDDPYIVNPTFTPDLEGGYTITLIVSDGEKTATDTVTINSFIGNHPPTANAGPDQAVHLSRTASLDGTASFDPEHQPLTYAWTVDTKPEGSTAGIADPTSATPTFTPDKTGTYVLGLIVSDGELTSSKDTLTITVANTAPIAEAGSDITVLFGSTANLNGSGSSDPDGDILTYAWVITSRPTGSLAILSDASSPAPTFNPDVRGAYGFKLTVSDGDLTSEDTVIVTCSNNVPVANAGTNATIEFGQTANLNGSASSDPDGDSLSFAWTITSGPDTGIGQLSNNTIVNPVFTPSRKGIYTLSLIVTDSEGLASAPDEVVITTTNHAPVAEAGGDITIGFPNKTVQLLGSGTDADSDPLTYQWTIISRPEDSIAELSSPTITNPTFLPDMKGPYVIGLIVNDGEVNSIEDTLTINVYNNAPTAEAGSDYSFTFGTGETVHLNGSASFDPDPDTTLAYSWTITSAPYGSTAALLPGSDIVNPSITPDIPGTYVISLIVFDGDLYSAADSVTITAINTGPTAEAGPDQHIGFPGITAYFDGIASHAPSGLPLSYTWEIVSAPSGSTAALSNTAIVNPSLAPDKKGVYRITLIVFDGFDYSPADEVTLTVGDMPVANAGPDQSLGFPGKTAFLDGSASYDPNGTMIISWSWTITSHPAGSTAIITNPGLVNPTFSPDKVGVYVISLVVSDGAFFSTADTVTITVINHQPVAEAGADQSVIFGYGAAANLDGSASSDADGATLTYAWTVASGPSTSIAQFSNAAIVNPAFIPALQGVYVIRLIVSDGYLFSAADTLTITATNQAPTANAGADINAAHGQTVALNGSGSTDPEGHSLTYAWTITSRPSGSTAALSNPAIVNPTFIADKSGSYVISLVVSDGVMTSAADTVTVIVSNNAPIANAGADISLIFGYGALAHLDGSLSSDPESQPLTYAWTITARPAGSTAALSSSTIVNPTFLPDKAGEYTVSLVVYDGDTYSTPDTLTITAANAAPHAEAGDNQTVAWNTLATLNGSGSFDPEAYPITYAWVITSAPTGSTATLSGAATASPSFTPNKTGAYVITLTVSDGVNTATDTVTITVPNNAPTAEAGADQNIFFGLGETATLNGSASSDPEGDPLTYSWTITSAPVGSAAALSDPAAVSPSLTPDKKGTYLITLTVSDGVNVSAADAVTITAYNVAPTIDAGSNQTVTWNTLATLSGTATDPESKPMTYVWTITSAPFGSTAALSGASTLTPSFTPDKSGSYVLTLSVSDAVNTVTDTLTITVPNNAPTAEAGPDQNIFFGTGLTATLDGSASHDPEGDTLTYTWAIVSSPSGSSASLSDIHAIHPTLTPDKKGAYLITLVVSDGVNLSASDAVTITAYNVAPTAEAGSNQSVFFSGSGATATLAGSGTDPESQPLTYAWTITSGPNTSISQLSNANIAGPVFTPTVKGSYVLSLVVNDGVNASTADTVSIMFYNAAPTANAGADVNPLYVGVATTLNGSGFDDEGQPLTPTWSVTARPSGSTAQPSNINIFNPTFTPDKKGSYTLSLVVSDGVNTSVADTMIITTPNRAPTANAGSAVSNIAYAGRAVGLNGGGSSDPDGDSLTYSWSITSFTPYSGVTSGNTATITNPTSATPTANLTRPGTYVISLTVNDGTVSSGASTVTLTTAALVTVTKNWDDNSMGDWAITTAIGTVDRRISSDRSHSASYSFDIHSNISSGSSNTTIVTTNLNGGSPAYLVSVSLWLNWYPNIFGGSSINTKLLKDGVAWKEIGPDDAPTFSKNTWAYRGDTSSTPYNCNGEATTIAFAGYDYIYSGADEMFFDDITYIVWR